MPNKTEIDHILFLDIETVPEEKEHRLLSEDKKKLWAEKSRFNRKEEFTAEEFYDRAGIWAEFGKIICISIGYFKFRDGKRSFRITSFYGEEEKLLREFAALLNSHFNKSHHLLCAHNGKEFDFPYIGRRMVINGLPLPSKLDLAGKKPWEVPHLDTMELWKFGDYKHYVSLKLLTNVLGIESPKEDIDGADVRNVYYIDNDLPRIVSYCERDVLAIAQIILKMRQKELLNESEVVTV